MNHPFQRLLLATEHSEFDAGVERIAMAMAARCGVPLALVLPIASNPEYEAVAPQLAAKAEAQAATALRALEAEARRAGVALNAQVRRGPELDVEIVAEATALGSDLIFTRQRGKRGFLARLLVGEMVSRVVAHAPCSVLLAPKDGQPWSKRVLVAIDPQAPETLQRQIAATAAAVAGECGLPLSVVCVADAAGSGAADGALARALDAARAHGVAATGETRSGKPFEQIIAAADALGADLLVVGRHGEALGGRAWLGSTTQKVIGLSERPVLVALPKSAAA